MEQVKIIPVGKSNSLFQMTKNFITPYEKLCVQLAEKLYQKDADVQIVVREIGDDVLICGLFYYSKGGTVLPFFLEKASDVEHAMKDFFSENLAFCVSGEKSSVDFVKFCIDSAKKQSLKEQRDFYFMEAKKPRIEKVEKDCLSFRQCTKDDSDFLFPLQISYIKEEVVPEGMDINLSAERFAMDRLLKAGKIHAAIDQIGRIVCKSQINGETDSYQLIGGVFTAEPFRKNGIATYLMECLKVEAAKKNKSCILFVNKKNEAAIRLYEKSGFTRCGDYKIIYLM